MRPDCLLPTVLSEPEQVRNGVFAAGQDQYVSGASVLWLTRVIDDHVANALQCGKIGEVAKVWQTDNTHAQYIFAAGFAVSWRLRRSAFERQTIFIVNAVIS